MKKISIVADNWKLPTFRKELAGYDFTFTEAPFTKDTTCLFINTDRISELHALCAKVQSVLLHRN